SRSCANGCPNERRYCCIAVRPVNIPSCPCKHQSRQGFRHKEFGIARDMCDSARMNVQHFFNYKTEIRTYRALTKLYLPHGSSNTPNTGGKKATQCKARPS